MVTKVSSLFFMGMAALLLFLGGLILAFPASAQGGHGKSNASHGQKNDQIHVHLKGMTDDAASVSVVYKGQTLTLTKKSAQLYSARQPGDIVKPDISEIVVKTTEGQTLIFSPASKYAGVEGRGTINYWITIEKPKDQTTSSKTSTSTSKRLAHHSGTTSSHPTSTTSTHHVTTTHSTSNHASNTTYKTVNGGKLPQTATPWYNLLAAGSLMSLFSGLGLYFFKRKMASNSLN